MTHYAYSRLVSYKRWADQGLCDVVRPNLDRLEAADATVVVRLLDHIVVVDNIFQHHLQGLPHGLKAPTSETIPDFQSLARRAREIDDWYAEYVDALPADHFDEPLDFFFTNGTPARMRRGEIILHVCLHGTYHRGNVGLILHKNGIAPNHDRMTDFLETTA
jgi:uncharacterized damage-inducible protein DinB